MLNYVLMSLDVDLYMLEISCNLNVWSMSLSSMKRVRGSTWGKNSDEIRKILGHSIAVDNNNETMAVEVEY
ncbi:hypothetical protein RHGRI_001390 [Rhododendron griersonianum]|uniref:Uncharacterized protein n=1 Tax=Rhododendron griersonianum TaxID=479676 RepID=A0AAV6LNW9_9ERIC|nr:hypothetical protein RHGRI_001390 [Rhododendron griersonianum]